MRLRYSTGFTILAGVLGVLLVAVAFTGQPVLAVTGGLMLLLAVLTRFQVVAEIVDDQLRIKNPFGMTIRRYPVAGPGDLRIEGNKVVHVATGRKTTSLGFVADPADAARWRAWVTGA